eukprot:scaffold257855_cov18-Tisochrysis_lutea.AAC.1
MCAARMVAAQDGGSTDKLHQARDVLRSTRVVVERFRCEASLMMRGQPHEHLHWITASRNQPNDAVAKLVSGKLASRMEFCGQESIGMMLRLSWFQYAGQPYGVLWSRKHWNDAAAESVSVCWPAV